MSLGAARAQLHPKTLPPPFGPRRLGALEGATVAKWQNRSDGAFRGARPVFEKKRSTAALTSTEKPPRSTQSYFKSLLVTCPKASRKKAKNYPLNAVEQEASTWHVWRFPLQILPSPSRVWCRIPESPAQHGRALWRECPSLPALPAHLYFVLANENLKAKGGGIKIKTPRFFPRHLARVSRPAAVGSGQQAGRQPHLARSSLFPVLLPQRNSLFV